MSTEDISLPSDKVQRKRRFTDQLNVVQEVEAKRSNNNLVDIEQEILNFHMDQQQQGEKNPNSLRTPEPKSSMSGSAKPANGTFRNVAPAQASSSSTSCSSSTANGTRKIVIRKFQRRNDPNTLNFDANWSILEDSVVKIQQRQSASVTCMELYNMVENLCQLNYTQEIYTRLQQLIRRFSELECARLVEKCEHVNFEAFLEMLNRLWETFCQQLSLIRSVFLYLDRTYRLQSATSISIWDLGLDAFRKFVVQNPNAGICPRTVSGILQLIELDRRGIQIDKHLLKSLLRMFMNLQIYERSFEREFLRVTEQFYKEESQTKIKELDVSQYLQFAQKRLLEEEERVHLYLEYSTYKKLIAIVDDCFITDNMDSIISDGPSQLLAENRIPELGLMYRLLSRVRDGQQALKNAFADYIKKTGRAMVMNTEQDKTLVSDLMAFKARLDIITVQSFEANERFQNASKDAFDFFVNTKPNKIAELIAKYMDSKLRTGNKECTEEELDSVMDRVIMLLRFVQGKDVFEAFYKKDLAKRLLLGRSASVDAEKAMLAKLRTECGAGLTQKLEGMFKDMEVSKDFCNTFKQYLDATDRDGSFLRLEVNVAILTMGHWPNYPTMEQANIPPQLAQLQQICAKFYTSKHNGRKLQWQYTLASGVLKAVFRPSVVKELEVSLFQAMVLLMFNDRTEWSYEQIFVSTKIDHLELKRTLQSLACGKFRVLQKQPRGREVSPGDNFIFNDEFNDRLYRIRISQVQMRETEQEHKQTEEQIFQDRQYQIDAAVVRIMKTRKKMTHNQLITDILTQLRFSVKAADLKKRIESLIERDYMTRDKEDPNMYHYVS